MKPLDIVSPFRSANTLFQGQQIKERTQRRRGITEGDHRREIKGVTRDAD
jgi:hypothetical protein